MRRFDWPVLRKVMAVAVLTIASFALRTACLEPAITARATMVIRGCAADLELMWYQRGIGAHLLPYVQTVLDKATGQPMTVEYPVLTGLLMWLLSLPVSTFAGFALLSTLVMGACAAVTAVVLDRLCGPRAWLWAASPALIHYLDYNYDAVVTMVTVLALSLVLGRDPLRVTPRHYLGAAALLGVGGALKLYPLILVLPLALWLLFGRPGAGQLPRRERARRAGPALLVGGGVFVALNLPFAIANLDGWLVPFRFQASRPIDITTLSLWNLTSSIWPDVSPGTWMIVASVTTAAGIAGAAAFGWLTARRTGAYPLVGTAVAIMAAYLLFNKVFSIQYVLWLLPLLILVGFRAGVVIAYQVLDVVMFWGWNVAVYSTWSGRADLILPGVGTLLLTALIRFVFVAWLGQAAVRVPRRDLFVPEPVAPRNDPAPSSPAPAVPA